METHANLIKKFSEINLADLPLVGGKNASLGEMFQKLSAKGVNVPDGFATTSLAYWQFIDENNLREPLAETLEKLDTKHFSNLAFIGKEIRSFMLNAKMPKALMEAIKTGYENMRKQYGNSISFAARSSATAEDLPNASFAGQQETYLNIRECDELIVFCQKCFSSLFTDRAIKYRYDNGFDHLQVALSVGIQLMVRSDKGSAGVIFTIDPDSGFENIVVVNGIWGLGENIVQGSVNPDEFVLYKPALKAGKNSVLSKKIGSKSLTMVYAKEHDHAGAEGLNVINLDTPIAKQEQFVLSDNEIEKLGDWAVQIEKHYNRPMDIEWAKDGITGELFIVQARPETIYSTRKKQAVIRNYQLLSKGRVLCKGIALGGKIASGNARILSSPSQIEELKEGEILITERTNPDWDPILKKAAAIVTNQGGRTSHAAIVAREIGAIAVVGTGNATETIQNGQTITVSTAEGETGVVYEGAAKWKTVETDISRFAKTKTKPMLILGDPSQAFRLAGLPHKGVGLMRLEFVINNSIRIHPMALVRFESLKDKNAKEAIEKITHHFPDKKEYFISHLSQAVATIAAAFYPEDVIVRMSDFKTNEYASLIGGNEFEPKEENPMIGFRGASRYYNERYKEGFQLECQAMKRVRDELGFTNVKLMIPFCRTVIEGKKVISLMSEFGLKQHDNGLEIYVMAEIPSNIILAEKFAEIFDGFSIGSNDLTQLTLGIDRDSEILSGQFNEKDEAAILSIKEVIRKAKSKGKKIGLCGQAPSDHPDFASFLVQCGIDSISFSPDAFLQGLENIEKAENKIYESNLLQYASV